LNLTVRKGEFIAFIGGFGSGKSSVLNAVLGEMYSEGSAIRLNGSVAYASQSPWIFNNTVKNNILFGEPFEEERY
jgi:ABC-type transport system involved in cytochrome bd biosynthesis fused ATPase/permease subunit